jgi:hypothetical protein
MGGCLPAGKLHIDWLALGEDLDVVRNVLQPLSAAAIAGAHLDRVAEAARVDLVDDGGLPPMRHEF